VVTKEHCKLKLRKFAQNITICFGILGILEIQDLKNDFVQGEQRSEFLFGLMKFITWDDFEDFEEISCIESSCFQFSSCAWFELVKIGFTGIFW